MSPTPPSSNTAASFVSGNTPCGALFEEIWQSRVLEERTQLNENIMKLDSFIEDSRKFYDLSFAQQAMLLQQRIAMSTYRDILDMRIRNF